MKSILDPTFRYTSSANTDLRKTFARIRRENRRQTQATPRESAEATPKVTPIFRGQRPAA
jgi:head-tail adaptor